MLGDSLLSLNASVAQPVECVLGIWLLRSEKAHSSSEREASQQESRQKVERNMHKKDEVPRSNRGRGFYRIENPIDSCRFV